MCGIAGIVNFGGQPDPARVRAMNESMVHRGPDHGGTAELPGVIFGHRRLSIIDLSSDANQPMKSPDGRYMISFNGEIYNYRELRQELAGLGRPFQTESDTEVLLNSYAQWGAEALSRLDGMFAFAIWDVLDRRLFLARDRMGEKPLYYRLEPTGEFVFASELQALLVQSATPRRPGLEALGVYLSVNYVPGHKSLVDGVYKLPPAHSLTLDADGSRRVEEYWNLASCFGKGGSPSSFEDAQERLRSLVSDSVRSRQVSDVALGAFLSGGLDSAIIVGEMCDDSLKAAPDTFTIGFSEEGYSEVAAARQSAGHYSATQHDQVVGETIGDDIEKILGCLDEPMADTSILPMFYLSKFARQSVTVALSGDGADELFAGYPTYAADRLRHLTSWTPSFLTDAVSAVVNKSVPDSPGKVTAEYKLKRFLEGHSYPAGKAHYAWRRTMSDEMKAALLLDDVRDRVMDFDPYSVFAEQEAKLEECHYLDRSLYVDIKTWLCDDILVKLDRMTMAHSLEARPPFLSHKLVEFAASLPVAWRMRLFQGKRILRNAYAHRLPPHLNRKRKLGFNAPVSHWLNGPLRDYGRSMSLSSAMLNYFDGARVETLWDQHESGRRNHSLPLFGLVCLGAWISRLDSLASPASN